MNRRTQRGVTLLELLVVVSIIAVMAGISFPSVSTGLDSIRLAGAADTVAAFLGSAVNRAERNQLMMELTISKAENTILLRAIPNFEKRLVLPDGIAIAAVLPEVPLDPAVPRQFLLYPGGAPPRIGVQIVNTRGARRIISLDPVTGVAQIEK